MPPSNARSAPPAIKPAAEVALRARILQQASKSLPYLDLHHGLGAAIIHRDPIAVAAPFIPAAGGFRAALVVRFHLGIQQ
ncbi:MAG: hypothetical protein ACREL5_09600 [Gemmatimonadales bacterium]